jgi:hypothetical protein
MFVCTLSDLEEAKYQGRDSLFMVSKEKLNLFFLRIQGTNNCQKSIRNEKIMDPQK